MSDSTGVPDSLALRYVGPDSDIVPIKRFPRRPVSTDKKYPIGQMAIIGKNPSTGVAGELWYLSEFVAGVPQWIQIGSASGGASINKVTTDDGAPEVLPDGDNNINVLGGTGISVTGQGPGDTVTIALSGGAVAVDSIMVDAASAPGVNPVLATAAGLTTVGAAIVAGHSVPIETRSRAANTYKVEVQQAVTVTATPANNNDVGLASFNDVQFVVDATSGMVSLLGGAGLPVLQTLTGDDTTAIGPDAAGNIDLIGTAVANATNAKPLYFNGSANQQSLEIQVAADITGAPGDKNDAGLVSFNDTQFVTDADGYTSLVGGADLASIQTLTADSTAVGPDANGDVALTVETVANATNATSLFIDPGTNAHNFEIQVAADRTGSPGDKADAGVCSFDDTSFTVDTHGYVSLAAGLGGGSLIYLATQTAATDTSIQFDDIFSATYDHYVLVVNNLVHTAAGSSCPLMQFSTDSGATFISTGYVAEGANYSQGSTSRNIDSRTNGIYVKYENDSAAWSVTSEMVIHIKNPFNSGLKTLAHGKGAGYSTGSGAFDFSTYGAYTTNAEIDSIKVSVATGSMTTGTFLMYGVKKS